MAGFRSISATGRSIRRLLELRFRDEEPITGTPTNVAILRTEDLDPVNMAQIVGRPALTIFLYRVDFNKTMRAAWSGVGLNDGRHRSRPQGEARSIQQRSCRRTHRGRPSQN